MDADQSNYRLRWNLERLLCGLTIERSCSAHAFTGCWLIDQLDSWNSALRATRLVLTEFEPGKLSLRSYVDRNVRTPTWGGSGGNVNDGALLVAWLPRQHRCIREVRVYDRAHFDRLSFISSLIVGPAPNLQCLVLHPNYRLESGSSFLQAFGPPQCLRDLDLTNVNVSDAVAPKVAEVLRENASTLHSVKLVGNNLSPESAGVLLLALVSCERLKDLTLEDSTGFSACDSMVELFRSSRLIQKLSLVNLGQAHMRCKHFGFTSRRTYRDCLTDLFAALRGALSLKHLALEETSVGYIIAEALAQFLSGHHSLQTVSLIECRFDITSATYIAEALCANGSLECLDLHKCFLDAVTVSKLCSALSVNTTLRSLVLPAINNKSPIIQEGNPTLALLRLESPDRVQFCLSVNQPSFVSEALAQALGCATKVKIYHGWSVGDVVCSVYASLALNHSLRSLHIDYRCNSTDNDDNTVGALCTALKACRHLQTFHLDVRMAYTNSEKTVPLLDKVFEALKHNPHLRKLSLVTRQLTMKTAESLSVLVAQYKMNLVELHMSIEDMSYTVTGVLCKMVMKNIFLSRISVKCFAWEDVVLASAAMNDAKERNQGLLNKAARFVMSVDRGPATSAEHHCAAAFEELCGTASLREHLAALSGKSGLEVSLDVKRARCYLQDNYMVFAGIVRTAVVCEGDGRLQLNALNVGCWRAVAQYLKLSDVVR